MPGGMSEGTSNRALHAVEYASAAIFAAAVGYAVASFAPVPSAAAGAMIAFLLCAGVLRAVAGRPPFTLPDFSLSDFEEESPDELLLTERYDPPACREEPLVLDDILAEIGPDSRVVRLFDRKAMPTPGQLGSRIDSHLDRRAPEPAGEDASQALSDALAELRRSLR